jgi:hypothetical protein
MKSKKKDYVSYFSYAVFLLDFLTLKDGSDSLSQNVGKELPLCAT